LSHDGDDTPLRSFAKCLAGFLDNAVHWRYSGDGRDARPGHPNEGVNGDGDDGPPPQLKEEDHWEGLYD
jgi:hypothetical protein